MGILIRILLIIILCLFVTPAFGATKYYAQSAAGSEDGSSCSNADAIADIAYSASDEIHLCGTITSKITIGANSVNLIFESGAKLSTTTWTSGGFITVSSKSGVVIDGGSNGIIEATDNGTTSAFGGTKGNADDLAAISLSSCTNCEIKNLTIKTIYDRLANSADCNAKGDGILATGDISGLSIHNNTISDCHEPIRAIATTTSSGVNIYNNTLSDLGVGIRAAPFNADVSTVNVYGNTVTGGSKWDGEWTVDPCACGEGNCGDGHVHQDGMQLYTVAGDSFTGLKVYNNFLQDFGTHSTAHIYVENAGAASGGTITSPQIYNNVFINTGANYAANGMLTCKSVASPSILNNTFVGNYPTTSGNSGLFLSSAGTTYNTNITLKNNIISSVQYYVNASSNIGTNHTFTASTYNCLYNGDASTPFYDGSMRSMAYWTGTLGLDATGSITTDPGLDGSYKPGASSNAKWAGTATGQLSATDKLGIAWHSPPSIGAYEYYEQGSIRGGVTVSGGTIQ